MPATTALDIITGAFDVTSVYAPGEAISATDANGALRRLKLLMRALKLQPLSQPVVSRTEYSLTANQGGPDNPYTIGPGGDFDTTRPIRLTGASILLVNVGGQNVEVPRAVITDDAWEAIQIKSLTATQFTDVYYNPTYTDDLGTINLWPIPNVSTNKLVLYRLEPLTTFADLTTEYDLPDGCEEALEYNLARRLLQPYGVIDPATVSAVMELAASSLATFKRANTKLSDLATDPAFVRDPSGGYNILTGTGGGTGG